MSSEKIRITVPPKVRPGEIMEVTVRLDHPMESGIRKNTITGQTLPRFYVKQMEVFYGPKKVSWMELTPGVSHKPMIKFKLAAGRGGRLKVRITNNRGQQFEESVLVKVA
jgi:sulfur-oxidizing protein SoxZ